MGQYLLSVYAVDRAAPPSDEEMQRAFRDVEVFNEEVRQAGAWVFAGGLEQPDVATVVQVADGETVLTDGPFAEGKEHIGGFWVITSPDLDAALAWAARATRACALPVEVRPFQSDGAG